MNQNDVHWLYGLGVAFAVGAIVPFFDFLVVIELFFLLIPIAIFYVGTIAYLVLSLLIRKLNTKKAFYLACIGPVFVASQLISTYTVDKIQRCRAEALIHELMSTMATTGKLPTCHDTPLGISFLKLDHENDFEVSYSRGFMVTEVYSSSTKTWKNYGWND
jgi:hypothetical protein